MNLMRLNKPEKIPFDIKKGESAFKKHSPLSLFVAFSKEYATYFICKLLIETKPYYQD
jgi:hypothetical protein